MVCWRVCLCAVLLVASAIPASAQVFYSDQTYRIFLRDGDALPSLGDYAVVADRVVFTLPLGAPGTHQELQLMSLPVELVDMERTARYAHAVRASRYAATRGEADYLAMTDEVARALNELRDLDDPATRLALAEEARRRLLAWSGENYAYRAADIQELAGLFEQVIAELRAAAGESSFALDLSTGPPIPALEPLLPAPTFGESIALALTAARAADLYQERLAILRSAASVADAGNVSDELRGSVTRALAAEADTDAAYRALEGDLLERAEAALASGDVSAVEALREELAARDRQLGLRRPDRTATLHTRLISLIEVTLAHRLALDHYAVARAGRLAYERQVRSVMSGLDSLAPVLEAVRDLESTPFERLERASARLDQLAAGLDRVTAPEDLADVHATLVSALVMARQAVRRWRTAVITTGAAPAREASAAAAGSLLLSGKNRADLVDRLFPPKPPGLARGR
jgi:hypothetical protein